MHFLTALLTLPAVVLAIQITSPAMNATWDTSATRQVEWTTVSTDPTSFNILLVNYANYPTISVTLADDVSSSSSPYTVAASVLAAQPSAITSGWQINFVNPANNGILAQSNQFNLEHYGSTPLSTASVSSSTSMSSTTTLASRVSSASSMASSMGSSTVAASSSATSSGAVASHTNAAASLHAAEGSAMGFIFAAIAALL